MKMVWVNKLKYKYLLIKAVPEPYTGPVIKLDENDSKEISAAISNSAYDYKIKYILSITEKDIAFIHYLNNKEPYIRYADYSTLLYQTLIKLLSSQNKGENMQ